MFDEDHENIHQSFMRKIILTYSSNFQAKHQCNTRMLRKYQVLQNNISNIIIYLAHIYKIPGAAYAGEPQHVANGSTKPFSGFDDNPKSMILIF